MLMGNSVCVSPTTRGSFTVLAGELNDIPPPPVHHPKQTTHLSSPRGFISGSVLPSAAPVVMVTRDDTHGGQRVSLGLQ